MNSNGAGRNTAVMSSLNSNLTFTDNGANMGPRTSIGGFKTANTLQSKQPAGGNSKKGKAKSKSKGASHRDKNRQQMLSEGINFGLIGGSAGAAVP